jgi:TPR repeat protein
MLLCLPMSFVAYSQDDCTHFDTIGQYDDAFACFLSDTLNPHKQYKIGEYYYEGKVVKKDYSKAVEWFKKSALGNDSDGQNNLGY